MQNENIQKACTSERFVMDLVGPDRKTPMKDLVKKIRSKSTNFRLAVTALSTLYYTLIPRLCITPSLHVQTCICSQLSLPPPSFSLSFDSLSHPFPSPIFAYFHSEIDEDDSDMDVDDEDLLADDIQVEPQE